MFYLIQGGAGCRYPFDTILYSETKPENYFNHCNEFGITDWLPGWPKPWPEMLFDFADEDTFKLFQGEIREENGKRLAVVRYEE
jgi:hypothetical protein